MLEVFIPLIKANMPVTKNHSVITILFHCQCLKAMNNVVRN